MNLNILHTHPHVHAQSLVFNPWYPMDYSPPGPAIHGVAQARITRVHCYFLFQGIFLTQDQTRVSSLLHWQADSFYRWATGKPPQTCLEVIPNLFSWALYLLLNMLEHVHDETMKKIFAPSKMLSVSIGYLLLNLCVCSHLGIASSPSLVSLTTFHVLFFMVYLSIFVEWLIQ